MTDDRIVVQEILIDPDFLGVCLQAVHEAHLNRLNTQELDVPVPTEVVDFFILVLGFHPLRLVGEYFSRELKELKEAHHDRDTSTQVTTDS